MGDTVRDDAAHEWRQLCQAAFLELDSVKLPQRICDARSAVLDQIENLLSKPTNGEQYALQSALETLRILQELAERDLSECKKAVQTHSAGYARYNKRESSA
jgi:hypothetical protein